MKIKNIDEMREITIKLFGIASMDEVKEDTHFFLWKRKVSSWVSIRKCDVNLLKEIENEYRIAIYRDCDENILILEFRVVKD